MNFKWMANLPATSFLENQRDGLQAREQGFPKQCPTLSESQYRMILWACNEASNLGGRLYATVTQILLNYLLLAPYRLPLHYTIIITLLKITTTILCCIHHQMKKDLVLHIPHHQNLFLYPARIASPPWCQHLHPIKLTLHSI